MDSTPELTIPSKSLFYYHLWRTVDRVSMVTNKNSELLRTALR
jgi:hypothetical protein